MHRRMQTEYRLYQWIALHPLAEAVQGDTHEVATDALNGGVNSDARDLADKLVILHRIADARIRVFPQAVGTTLVLLVIRVVPSFLRLLRFTVVPIVFVKVLPLFIKRLVQM